MLQCGGILPRKKKPIRQLCTCAYAEHICNPMRVLSISSTDQSRRQRIPIGLNAVEEEKEEGYLGTCKIQNKEEEEMCRRKKEISTLSQRYVKKIYS
ncbi:hypothetical protein PSENEW3_00002428 [Picochlorum sp. SENEW3]|nr:hypothetical protein PSENEW3_00002428 [Picochlorum sp. SENEW3]